MVPVHPEQTGPGFTSTSPALSRSSRICRAGWAAPVVKKGGCAPPMAQAGCVGPDSRICVLRLHLLAGHHVKVPDRCPAHPVLSVAEASHPPPELTMSPRCVNSVIYIKAEEQEEMLCNEIQTDIRSHKF